MADPPKIEIVDPGAGDIFADEALDFDIINNTLRIRFGVARPNAPAMPAQQQLVHVGRLIMPLESAQRLCIGLYDFLKNAGADPALVAHGSDQKPN